MLQRQDVAQVSLIHPSVMKSNTAKLIAEIFIQLLKSMHVHICLHINVHKQTHVGKCILPYMS